MLSEVNLLSIDIIQVVWQEVIRWVDRATVFSGGIYALMIKIPTLSCDLFLHETILWWQVQL